MAERKTVQNPRQPLFYEVGYKNGPQIVLVHLNTCRVTLLTVQPKQSFSIRWYRSIKGKKKMQSTVCEVAVCLWEISATTESEKKSSSINTAMRMDEKYGRIYQGFNFSS